MSTPMPTTETPAPKPRNPNRDLAPTEVIQLFRRRLPKAMLSGIVADREWLWWSGEKPDEQARAILGEIGFQFTRSEHALPDGRVAHWYHACGGFGKRTGRRDAADEGDDKSAPSTAKKHTRAGRSGARHTTSDAPSGETSAVESFLRFAQSIQ